MGEEKSATSIIQHKIGQANFINCYSLEFDLYDVSENDVLIYTFNVSTLNPFGCIFYYVVIAGGFGYSELIIWSLLSRRKIKSKL